ncbi:MAG: EamA family transporter [Candidatus Limnocylindrales bacterium]
MTALLPYALALTVMFACIYLALDEIPLGVVSAILMLGPLTVSALGSHSRIDLGFVGLAAIGVMMLTLSQGTTGPMSVTGILLALVAAGAFATYIYTGKRVGKEFDGLGGLAIALVITTVLLAPVGLAYGRPGMWSPEVLVAIGAAGVLATVIPYSLEMVALKNLSAATFGLLLALEPAIAAVMGFVIRDEQLAPIQLVGIAIVVIASAGSLGPRGWTRRIGAYNRALMSHPAVAALANIPLFSGLSARDLQSIASVAEERDAQPGDVLIQQGAGGGEFFIVAAGEVAIDVNGDEVRRLGPGDHLGEIALVFGGKRTATATASVPTHLYVLGEASFAKVLKAHPRIEDKILTSVSERMRYR